MRWWLGVADICAGDGECLCLVGVSGAPRATAAVAPAVVVPAAAGELFAPNQSQRTTTAKCDTN
eukprot:255632-Pelagomonas_calceolata.AAC.2